MTDIGTFQDGRILISVGDITTLREGAIVNAANGTLLGGGGVDGAIHNAAGPALLEECRTIRDRDYPDGLPPGRAVTTSAGRLPLNGIIHTVGPVWHGGSDSEEDLLRSCYREALILAHQEGFSPLAFPAISTGVYGYPRELAGRIALTEIGAYLESHEVPEKVRLVFYSQDDAATFLSAVS